MTLAIYTLSSELEATENSLQDVIERDEKVLRSILQKAEVGEDNLGLLDEIVFELAGDGYEDWVEMSAAVGLNWPKRASVISLANVD